MATTITTVSKRRLGKEDIYFDDAGSDAEAVIKTSDGTSRFVKRVNASHIPTTTATRAKTDASGTALNETNIDSTLQQLLDDNALQGIPDGTTLEVVGGVLRIKDAGVTTAKIADGSVATGKIADDAVTSDKLATDSVTADAIAAGAVDTAELANDAVEEAKIANGAVTNDKVGDGEIKAAKMADVPTHYVAEVGSFSSSATGTSTFTNAPTQTSLVAGTDFVHIQMRSVGTGPTAITSAAITGGNQITATTNANQTAGTTVFDYVIYRPVTP